ncbi:F-box/kelch-repeat protein At1g24800-like [Raphanus sativus]|uniref:F-box/kelch-repeat protein At1g24800-like n=1 Tax=Raphanus sativus TaxID=3726 RepID=A0A9W3CEB0_RAPSA|nr:F-box/kelch-repeat protein At1g24800-like [Raphanus sativus]
MMSDELVGEKILTSTSPKAVGSTDAGKEAEAEAAPPAQPPQLFLTMNGEIYSLERFQEDFVHVSVNKVDFLNDLDVSKLYHCDGLVLCVATDKKKDKDKKEEPKLVLWNPYLCQTRWIEPREEFNRNNRFAIGYSSSDDGSDSQRNHKILRFGPGDEPDKMGFEIYDIKCNTWRVLEVVINNPVWWIGYNQGGVSVKGNAYFLAHHLIDGLYGYQRDEIFLLSFDFTQETFGPRLSLPFHDSFDGFSGDCMFLSNFLRRGDDEQLAVLFGGYESGFFEIWVTLTVDPNRASWSKFLRMDPGPFSTYGFQLCTPLSGGSFFVDEDNKVAVLFELFNHKPVHKAFVFGQDCRRFKSSVDLGEALILENRCPFTNRVSMAARPPLVCSSPYRPSLVQVIQPPLVHKRKRKRMSPSDQRKRIV